MPGYSTHVLINLTGLTAAAAVALSFGLAAAPLVATAAASAVVATFFLSPDLDLRHSSPSRNWWVLKWLWVPYQMVFRHRGLSHSLLLSSATRIAYLLAASALVAASVHLLLAAWLGATPSLHLTGLDVVAPAVWAQATAVFMRHTSEFAAAGAGVWLSDVLHIAADRVGSAAKILFRL